MKMEEIQSIKDLLCTAKIQKRELLDNLGKEISFKVNLRSEKAKEKGVEELILQQMNAMRKMFNNLDAKITNVNTQVSKMDAKVDFIEQLAR